MRRAIVWISGIVLVLVAAAAMGVTYVFVAYPKVGPAADVTAPATADAVERGRYLANHVSMCTDCHTPRDWTRFAGPVDATRLGAGGEVFDEGMGLPGRIISKNITPAALSSWTDGEILRAFTAGVSKDGTALFPLMPYYAYGRMDRNDALAIVAYLRTLPAHASTIEDRHLDFPVSLLVRTLPAAAQFGTRPDPSDRVAYGGYLATIGGCSDCHTPVDDQQTPRLDRLLAGGRAFTMPNGVVVRTANLTPHETGIGGWSEADFVERFARFRSAEAFTPVPADGANTPMPWGPYSGMTDEDLSAIYAYLRTVPAIDNTVASLQPAH